VQKEGSDPAPPVVERSNSNPTYVSQQHAVSMVQKGLNALQRRLDLAKHDLILKALLDPPFQPSGERRKLSILDIMS
jgi:hypothetical protein